MSVFFHSQFARISFIRSGCRRKRDSEVYPEILRNPKPGLEAMIFNFSFGDLVFGGRLRFIFVDLFSLWMKVQGYVFVKQLLLQFGF